MVNEKFQNRGLYLKFCAKNWYRPVSGRSTRSCVTCTTRHALQYDSEPSMARLRIPPNTSLHASEPSTAGSWVPRDRPPRVPGCLWTIHALLYDSEPSTAR